MTNELELIESAAAELAAVAAPDQVNTLEADIRKAMKLTEFIAGLEAALRAQKEALMSLMQHSIPDGMAALGIIKKEVDGATVTYHDFVNGSLPKDAEPREEALEWLIDNGASPLVKAFFDFSVPKGEREKLDNVIGNIEGILEAHGLELEEETTIHPQTLYAFVRERMRKGEPVPLDTLGLHTGRVARIKLPLEGEG